MRRREFIQAMAAVAAVGLQPGCAAQKQTPAGTTQKQTMPQHRLGKTGVIVSALALGGVIGMQLPPSDDHDPVAIAETALELGITYFDTAPSYNSGQSEKNYGQVLARRRKEVFLVCKTGDRSYDGTMRSAEQSLRNLRTDHFGQRHQLPQTDSGNSGLRRYGAVQPEVQRRNGSPGELLFSAERDCKENGTQGGRETSYPAY